MTIVQSFCALCLLLAAGKLLRVKVRVLHKLYLPSSVVGGILGLVIIQCAGVHLSPAWTAGWTRLPGALINIVFAALFLGVAVPGIATVWRKSAPQLAYGQIVAWGQYVVGLGLVVLILRPLFGVPALFGAIVPIGFEGGHGTAGGLAETFGELGWAEGADYGLAAATAGIVSAIIVGMALVNWAVRRGHVQNVQPGGPSDSQLAGFYPADACPVAGYQTVRSDSVDALALHLAIIGVAILAGFVLKQALVALEVHAFGIDQGGVLKAFPLFPLCMIGGLIVQLCLTKLTSRPFIDRGLTQRIAGTALDFLVVAAISTIRLEVIAKGIWPFAVIVAGAIGWNVFCVTFLARRLLPDAWFERAIAEMGQSMGVTATGLLLLRVVDPESKTEARSAFAYKQLLHEPFMGGGLWTSAAVLLVWKHGAGVVLAVSFTAIAVWLTIWWLLLRPRSN